MRKLLYTFLAFVAISSLTLTTSCSDDDKKGDQEISEFKKAAIIDSLCSVAEYVDTFSLAEGNGLYGLRFMKDGKLKLDVFTEFYDSINDKQCVYPMTVNLTWELDKTPIGEEDGVTYYAIHSTQKKADNMEFNRLADSLYQTGLLDEPVELADDDLDTLFISVDNKTGELNLYLESLVDVNTMGQRGIGQMVSWFFKQCVKLTVAIEDFVNYEKGVAGDKTRGDWMANINNLVPICKMSIPGTHDTFSYTCQLSANWAKTQELNLEDQWAVGIRCFDIRLCYFPNLQNLKNKKTADYNEYMTQMGIAFHAKLMGGADFSGTSDYVPLQICHGGFLEDNATILLTRNVEHAFDQLKELLHNHSQETAIVVLKFDCDETANGRKLLDKFVSEQVEDSVVVKWRPGIKLGEARGKIIVVARYMSEVEGLAKAFNALTSEEEYGKIGKDPIWGDNRNDSYLMDLKPDDKWTEFPDKIAPLYVQDLYEIGNGFSWDDKKKLVRENLEKINDADNVDEYIWAFNHMSGMKNIWGAYVFMNYAQNAEVMNPYIEELLNEEQNKTKYTGIIPIDWAGWSELMSGGANVVVHYNSRGATTPGRIINQNVNLKWHYVNGTTFPFTTKKSL